ncbi:MAG TPA: GNAT family N-acetyltransferase [Candidatus Dormibacteraeota bacterium]|nr:GNAT family N-acetyltransferase [Candidatus Dormibacteraeota bacterium]
MLLTIRPMVRDDLDDAVASIRDGGWGDRRSWFEFALDHEACDPLVAFDGDRIVGTGAGTRNGRAGWVGTIFVAPDRRREGIGRAITEVVCERLEAAGCTTLLLVATDLGRPVYERLGFEGDGWYRVLEAEGTGEASTVEGSRSRASGPHAFERLAAAGVRPFTPGDLEEASDLDTLATGEDRRHLLEAFAGVPRNLALRSASGELRGFVARGPWGGGATVAATAEEAERLLGARLATAPAGHQVRAGLLEANQAGIERLHELGWTDARRIVRMRRGAPLDWRPQMIWGQFNFATG